LFIKSQLFLAKKFLDLRYKSIKNKELRLRHDISTLIKLWIGQGEHTIAHDFRFVQQTKIIPLQFFCGFENAIKI